MKKVILLLLVTSTTFMNSQSSWKKINLEKIALRSERINRNSNPSKFELYALSVSKFKTEITNKSKIYLPSTNGKLALFQVEETTNFTNAVTSKYGYIKSFTIKGIDDKTAFGKISIGTDGVFATISSGKHSTIYIDPYTKDKKTYSVYKRSSLKNDKANFNCLSKAKLMGAKKLNRILKRNANDGKLRIYKLALACTGEYAQFHIKNQGLSDNASDVQKKAAVLSAMNTSITRVNSVYERDLSVKLNIVLNANGENPLIFLDRNTDDLSNNDLTALLDQSQQKCDKIIGTNNYDIGHTLCTGEGGQAYIGFVCNAERKGSGVTGSEKPIGVHFDIDFISHEIGHQFGAFHVFNNSCEGQRSLNSSVEPGSGSSIMGYAGVCQPSVQENSNDYFSSVSIAEMWNYIKNGATCNTVVNTNNLPPTANAGSDVSVPKSTPLVLRGNATDTDTPNTLTYCWEQIDPEIATMPPVSTNNVGPLFRSLPPTVSTDRYLPKLETVVSGNLATTWEVLPSVARIMNFSLLIRDNNNGGGATARDDIKITVTNSDPFVVTSQNTATTWDMNTNQTITWNKALTNQAPINCANVRIRLSTDGGLTFPIILTESTPNDGNHTINVPNITTSKARIMVEAIDNIFYNVNSTNFSIIESTTFSMENTTGAQTVCNNTIKKANYTINFKFVNGFNENISLSSANLPNGANVTFSPSTINTSGNVTVSIDNLNNVSTGNYPIEIIANTTSVTKKTTIPLVLQGNSFPNTSLNQPVNNNTQVGLSPILQWATDADATSYTVEIATDENFNNTVLNSTITKGSYKITSGLEYSTTYYWRVKPKGQCGEGNYSSVFNFTTIPRAYFTITNNTQKQTVCNNTNNPVNYILSINSFNGFNKSVSFNATNLPNGSNATFNPSKVNSTGNVTMSINNLKGAIPKSYNIKITAKSTSVTEKTIVSLIVKDSSFDNISLSKPLNKSTKISLLPKLEWSAINRATSYVVEVASDNSFNKIILTKSVTKNSCLLTSDLEYSTTYYWRVKPKGECGEGNYSSIFSFTTTAPAIPIPDFYNFLVYPNPSNGNLTLRFKPVNKENIIIKLFDLKGRLISTKERSIKASFFSEEITFRNISSGLYLIQLNNGNNYTSKKIIFK